MKFQHRFRAPASLAARAAKLCLLPLAFATKLAVAEEKPLWELGGGVAALSYPDYRGSNRQRAYLLPVPYFVYRGEMLQMDRDKMRGLLFKRDRLELDISIDGSVPVRSRDNGARQGMPNLDPTIEIGPSLNVLLYTAPEQYKLTFKLPLRAVVASDFRHVNDAGVLSHPQLNLDIGMRDGWRLGLVAGVLVADRRYHDYFYGVAQPFATAVRPAYHPPGGYSGAQFIVATSKRFERMWLGAFVKYDNISGAAFQSSPLVERRNNLSAGIAVTWIFAQSQQRVDRKE